MATKLCLSCIKGSLVTHDPAIQYIFRVLQGIVDKPENIFPLVTPELFGAVGDGITDDTQALEAALQYLSTQSGKKTLLLTKTYKCTVVEFDVNNLLVTGTGTIKDATVYVGRASLPRSEEIDFVDITIEKSSLVDGNNGLTYRYITGSTANRVTFRNVDKCAYSAPIDSIQHANRLTIDDCRVYNVNYLFYADKAVGAINRLPTGDVHIQNNMRTLVNKVHVYGLGLDGLECVGNTFFFKGGALQDPIKQQNIYIEEGSFIDISNNQLFEAGQEGVYLVNCVRASVLNNRVVWSGQRIPSSAIKIMFTAVQTTNNWTNISNNQIDSPTLHGVELGINCFGGSVVNNQFSSVGNNEHYYGATAFPSTHYYITMDVTNKYYQVTDNNAGYNNGITASYNFIQANVASNNHRTHLIKRNWDSNLDEINQSRELGVASAVTSITVTGYDQINLNSPSAHTITVIGGGATNGYQVKLIGFTGNTTLQNNANIALKGGVNALIPLNGILRLEKQYGVWIEVSRNF